MKQHLQLTPLLINAEHYEVINYSLLLVPPDMYWFVLYRAILSHFEDKDVTDVGGTDRCCDNCSRRYLFLQHIHCNLEKPKLP